jgi:hypothetical protein
MKLKILSFQEKPVQHGVANLVVVRCAMLARCTMIVNPEGIHHPGKAPGAEVIQIGNAAAGCLECGSEIIGMRQRKINNAVGINGSNSQYEKKGMW